MLPMNPIVFAISAIEHSRVWEARRDVLVLSGSKTLTSALTPCLEMNSATLSTGVMSPIVLSFNLKF